VTIIETIDNAIRDHGMSPDAMRWTPDAPKLAAPVRCRLQVPTPEQIAEASARFRAAMAPVAQQMRLLGEALTAGLAPLLAELERQQRRPVRSERVRQTRVAYRQRRR
jgi:hypothetical protein